MKKYFLLSLLLFLSCFKTFGQTVNTQASLESVITNYNIATSGSFTITFADSIVLTTALTPINNTNGATLVINGGNYALGRDIMAGAFRILEITNGNVTINNLKIQNGNVDGNGAGILNNGVLKIVDCQIQNNTATNLSPRTLVAGGGIYNTNSLTILRSTISKNIVTNTSFVSAGAGAGIFHASGNLAMDYSTISGNQIQNTTGFANIDGAGMYLNNSNFQLNNISVVSNINAAGLAILPTFTPTQLQNSLFLANTVDIRYLTGTPNVDIGSQKLLFTSTNGSLTTATSQIVSSANIANIISSTLANNGGITQTHALVASSGNVAIEGGTAVVAGETDQRGDDLLGTNKDIGAYEFGTFWVVNNNGASATGSFGAALAGVNTTTNLGNTIVKKIKFNIPSPNNTITVNFNPSLALPAIIDATTQPNYMLAANSRVIIAKGTGNAGTGLNIISPAHNSKILGLNWVNFSSNGIVVNANNVTIGDYVSSPLFNGLNVFQNCGYGISISPNISQTKIYNNYFGLNENGTDGGATIYNDFADIFIDNGASNTSIGDVGKNNFLAAKNGGIFFNFGTVATTNTAIIANVIGESVTREAITSNSNGIYNFGSVDGLTIKNNVIVNKSSGIYLSDDKNVTIEENQIGWQYNTLNVPEARPNFQGIFIRPSATNPSAITGIIIRKNSIAGNSQDAIAIDDGTLLPNAMLITENRIGLANDTNETILLSTNGIRTGNTSTTPSISTNNFLIIDNNVIGASSACIVVGRFLLGAIQPVQITNNKIGVKTDGTTTIGVANGIITNADSTTPLTASLVITGNTIVGAGNMGIDLSGIQDNAHVITGNYIGTNANGNTGLGNGTGILINSTCTNLVIGSLSPALPNIISGNIEGIKIINTNGVTIQNNYIGTNPNGTSALGNSGTGIIVRGTSTACTIQKNVVSGNGDAITLETGTSSTTIDSNLIGTTANGLGVIRNTGVGITVLNNIIGTIIKANTISGNNDGVVAQSPLQNFQNNKIGTNAAGTGFLTGLGTGNAINAKGISLQAGTIGSVIKNNVIADCGNQGIYMVDSDITIQSNRIGVNTTGSLAMPTQQGIQVSNNLLNILIGGSLATDGNIISANSTGIDIIANTLFFPSNITIANNLIGTDETGLKIPTNTTSTPTLNSIGIQVGAKHGGLKIINNTISGNITGLNLNSPLSNTTDFANNIFGLNKNADAKLIGLAAGQYANTTGIIVNANAAGTNIDTQIFSDNNTAINWSASGTSSTSTINNNKIGVDKTGTVALPNSTSIVINNVATATSLLQITNNTMVSTFIGVSSVKSVEILNNNFGTDVTGNIPLQTVSAQQISLQAGADNSNIQNNVIGGASNSTPITVAGTTVTGSGKGILVAANAVTIDNNNLIGITRNDSPFPNDIGVSLESSVAITNSFVGNFGSGNTISNNKNVAIYLSYPNSSSGNSIFFNNIGMKSLIDEVADNTTEFGIVAESGVITLNIDNNVINKTNTTAITCLSSSGITNNTINENYLGTLKDKTTPLANANNGDGISVVSKHTISSNVIQNTAGVAIKIQGVFNTLYSNIIRNNGLQGISISSGFANRIAENAIYANGGTTTPNPKGIDLNLTLPLAQQGNNGQAAPIITSASILSATQVALSGTVVIADGTHLFYFYRTTSADVGGNADLVEGKDYLGQANINVVAGVWSTTITLLPTLSPAISPTDFVTANIQDLVASNTSEFSIPSLFCSTTITGITTQSTRQTCAGSLTDVRINLTTNTNIGNLFNVDTNGDGIYEYTNLALQNSQTGLFILIPNISSTTFNNTKVFDQFASCTSASFVSPNPIIILNNALPLPTIVSATTTQATSCNTPNGQLLVKIQNGTVGQSYELSTNGVFGAEYSGLVLGTDNILRVNLGVTERIGDLQLYQGINQCVSPSFSFSSQMVTPLQNIDSTLTVQVVVDEISPNFSTVVSLLNTQDSVSYRLFNRTLNRFIGIAQLGNRATLNFTTDTLQQVGRYTYEITATHIRTGCSRTLLKTALVQVISGILPEELDVLRAVYTSTNGDFWKIKWDFSKDISTFLGVSIFGGRVTNILLPNNNLSGTLTNRVLALRKLRNLDIGNNSLDFASVESFVGAGFTFNYKIQAKINTEIDTTAYSNTKMELTVKTGGGQNRYQWTKDNQPISNANLPTLTLNPLQLTDAGIYACTISNAIGTELILERKTIRLRVNSRNIPTTDSLLLIQLNDALGGQNWKNKWDRTKPVAEWYGISITGDKITAINLADNNLVGKLPNIIPLTSNILSNLIYLNLSGNRISGEIPSSLGNLSKLQYLDLSENLLEGEVIAEIGKLQELKNLLLAYNNLTSIHIDISKLAKIENLVLSNNAIATIPAELNQLSTLKTLNLSNNFLKSIPSLSILINLESFSIANNQLTSIPNMFGNLPKLESIYLQNNLLTALPTSFTRLNALKIMVLHSNFLDFEDLELLSSMPILNSAGAIYEPQAKIGTSQEILFTLDQALNLLQTVNGKANTFQWFKNGLALPNGNSNKNNLTNNMITLADAGVYRLEVQNTIAKKLTLVSYDIIVKVSCGNSTSITINAGGTTRYCEGETINTLLSADVTANVQVTAYQWFRNNSVLAGETKKILSIIQEGNYSLQATDINNCVFLSKPVLVQVLPKPRISLQRKGDSLSVHVVQSAGKLQYIWYKDNTVLSEWKSNQILAVANGMYYVVVTDSSNCPTKSSTINLVISGIEDDLAKNLVIYPNPSNGKITVTLPPNFVPIHTSIHSIIGELLLENKQKQDMQTFEIVLQNAVSGTYILTLQNDKGLKIRKKIVVQ